MIYRRDPAEIQVSSDYLIAWEQGTWTGTVAAGGAPLIRGRYSAQWVKVGGQWLIRSELFVALECSGAACNWPVSASLGRSFEQERTFSTRDSSMVAPGARSQHALETA
jgi:hypothetical protein